MSFEKKSSIAKLDLFRPLKEWASKTAPVPIVTVWIALAGTTLSQLVIDPEPPMIQAFEVSVPLMLSLPLLYTAVRIHGDERAPERQSHVLLIGGLFAIISVGMLVLFSLTQVHTNLAGVDILFTIAVGSTVGASLGGQVGIIYDDIVATKADLKNEIRRSQRLNQRLQVVNRLLRHNIRNTLNVVMGLLNRVGDRIDDCVIAEDVELSISKLSDLHGHCDKLLSVKQLHEDSDVRVTMDVESIIESIVEGIDEEVVTGENQVAVRSQIDGDTAIRGHTLVPLAINEAVANAIEHNDHDDLTVDIRARSIDEVVSIEIIDDGSGVSKSEIDPLTRDEESPLQHGTGVGLWLIKWVCEVSNGSVSLFENDAGGTTVQLLLPRD